MPLLKEPAISLEGVRVRALTLTSLDLEVDLSVKNPNLFGVTLRDLPFSVFCTAGGKELQVATGNAGSVKIKGNASTVLAVPVTAHNAGLIGAVTSFVAQGGIEITVKGTAIIDCFITCKSIPFTKSIRLTTKQTYRRPFAEGCRGRKYESLIPADTFAPGYPPFMI